MLFVFIEMKADTLRSFACWNIRSGKCTCFRRPTTIIAIKLSSFVMTLYLLGYQGNEPKRFHRKKGIMQRNNLMLNCFVTEQRIKRIAKAEEHDLGKYRQMRASKKSATRSTFTKRIFSTICNIQLEIILISCVPITKTASNNLGQSLN